MQSLTESVNNFLGFNQYKILDDKGKISHTNAKLKAHTEYGEFNKTKKIQSDFDRNIKKLLRNEDKK